MKKAWNRVVAYALAVSMSIMYPVIPTMATQDGTKVGSLLDDGEDGTVAVVDDDVTYPESQVTNEKDVPRINMDAEQLVYNIEESVNNDVAIVPETTGGYDDLLNDSINMVNDTEDGDKNLFDLLKQTENVMLGERKYGVRNVGDNGILGARVELSVVGEYSGTARDFYISHVDIGDDEFLSYDVRPIVNTGGKFVFYLQTFNVNTNDVIGYNLKFNGPIGKYSVSGKLYVQLTSYGATDSASVFNQPESIKSNLLISGEDVDDISGSDNTVSNGYIKVYANQDNPDSFIYIKINDDGKVDLDDIQVAVKEGYKFVGWENIDTGEMVSGLINATEDTKIRAVYKDSRKEVTFNYGDGKVEKQLVEEGAKISAPVVESSDRKRFIGWYNGEEQFDFENNIINDNIELVAKYDIYYLVEFWSNDILFNSVYIKNGNKVDTPVEPESIESNKRFAYWVTIDDVRYDFDSIVFSDIRLNAFYSDVVVVELDANGGICDEYIEAVVGKEIGELPEPIFYEGGFDGWYVDNKKIDKDYVVVGGERLESRYLMFSDYAVFSFEDFTSNSLNIVKNKECKLIRDKIISENVDVVGECGVRLDKQASNNNNSSIKHVYQCIYMSGDVADYFNYTPSKELIPCDFFSPIYYWFENDDTELHFYTEAEYVFFTCSDVNNIYCVQGVNKFSSTYGSYYDSLINKNIKCIKSYPGVRGSSYVTSYASDIDLWDTIFIDGLLFNSLKISKLDFSKCKIRCGLRKGVVVNFSGCNNLNDIVYGDRNDIILLKTMREMFMGTDFIMLDLSFFSLDINNFKDNLSFSFCFSGCNKLINVVYPVNMEEFPVRPCGHSCRNHGVSQCNGGTHDSVKHCNCFSVFYKCPANRFDFNMNNCLWTDSNLSGQVSYATWSVSGSFHSATQYYAGTYVENEGDTAYVNIWKYHDIVNDSNYEDVYPDDCTGMCYKHICFFMINGRTVRDILMAKYVHCYSCGQRCPKTDFMRFTWSESYDISLIDRITGDVFNIDDVVPVCRVWDFNMGYKPKPDRILTGSEINAILNKDMKSFKYAESLSTSFELHDISLKKDGSIVTWFDENDSTQYIYSRSGDVYFNYNSSQLFSDCVKLESVDLSKFKFDDVLSLNEMFCNCSCLNRVVWPQAVSTTNVFKNVLDNVEENILFTGFSKIFQGCIDGVSLLPKELQYLGVDENGNLCNQMIDITFNWNDKAIKMVMGHKLCEYGFEDYVPVDDTYEVMYYKPMYSRDKITAVSPIYESCLLNYELRRIGLAIAASDIKTKLTKEGIDYSIITEFRMSDNLYYDDAIDISVDGYGGLYVFVVDNVLYWYSKNKKFIPGSCAHMFNSFLNIEYVDLSGFDFQYLDSYYNTYQMFANCSKLANIVWPDKWIDEDKFSRYYRGFSGSSNNVGYNYSYQMFYNCPANKPSAFVKGRWTSEGTYILGPKYMVTYMTNNSDIPNYEIEVPWGYKLCEVDGGYRTHDDPSGRYTFESWQYNNVDIDEQFIVETVIKLTARWSGTGYCDIGSNINRQISSYAQHFVQSFDEPPSNAVDISLFKEGSVKTWYDSSSYTQYWWSVSGVLSLHDNSSKLFESKSRLVDVDLNNVDFRYVKNMSYLFSGCSNLISILNFDSVDIRDVTNMAYMFNNCSKMKDLDLSGLNTQSVENMSYMFAGMSELEYIDISMLDTSSVQDATYMFYNDKKLNNLDFSNFDLSSIVKMHYMFYYCYALSDVTYGDMFVLNENADCSSTSSYNPTYCMYYKNTITPKPSSWTEGRWSSDGTYIKGYMLTVYFNVNKPSAMSATLVTPERQQIPYGYTFNEAALTVPTLIGTDGYTFEGWYTSTSNSLITLTELSNLPITSNTTVYARWSKAGCTKAGQQIANAIYNSSSYTTFKQSKSKPGSDVQASYITDVSEMMDGSVLIWRSDADKCIYWWSSTGKMKLPSDAQKMFYSKSYLTSIDLTNIDFSDVTTVFGIFASCSRLTSVDVSLINSSKLVNIKSMFENCSAITSVDISKLNTDTVQDCGYMFNGCVKLTNVILGSNKFKNSLNSEYMFQKCSVLESLDLSGANFNNVTNARYMFNNCPKLSNISFGNNALASNTNMEYMFYGCSQLVNLDLSKLTSPNLTSMYRTFYGCMNLTTLKLNSLDTRKVTSFYQTFYNDAKLTSVTYGGNFKPDACSNFSYMMYKAPTSARPSSWTGTWATNGTYTK